MEQTAPHRTGSTTDDCQLNWEVDVSIIGISRHNKATPVNQLWLVQVNINWQVKSPDQSSHRSLISTSDQRRIINAIKRCSFLATPHSIELLFSLIINATRSHPFEYFIVTQRPFLCIKVHQLNPHDFIIILIWTTRPLQLHFPFCPHKQYSSALGS